jgi:hypothetical protein
MIHAELGQVSRQRYAEQLRRILAAPDNSRRLKATTGALLDSLEELKVDAPVDERRFAFTDALLAALTEEERGSLVNQYCLGLGYDGAPVVTVGIEQAFDLADVGSFALESCLSALQLARATEKDAVRCAANKCWGPEIGRRPFHLEPNDYHRVHANRGRHTWNLLSSLLFAPAGGQALRMGAANKRLGRAHPGLGGRTYQLEASAHPSKAAMNGHLPTPERATFLAEAIRALRLTASVLLFHVDRGRFQDLAPLRAALGAAFLGLPGPGAHHPVLQGESGKVWVQAHEGRCVLAVDGHLSGAVKPVLLGDVRAALDRALAMARGAGRPWLRVCRDAACSAGAVAPAGPPSPACPRCGGAMEEAWTPPQEEPDLPLCPVTPDRACNGKTGEGRVWCAEEEPGVAETASMAPALPFTGHALIRAAEHLSPGPAAKAARRRFLAESEMPWSQLGFATQTGRLASPVQCRSEALRPHPL